jgi:LDH2 family malate/lactate/ureidoglycolate dehydrogenase
MPGHDRIRLPGEGRAARLAERADKGVPLSPPLLAKLGDLAKRLGIKPLAGG